MFRPLLHLLLCLLPLGGFAQSNPPPWARSILSIEGTNTATQAPAGPFDHNAAVRSLSHVQSAVTSDYAGLIPQIYSLPPDESVSATNMDQRAEEARVVKIIQQADALYRDGQGGRAVTLLTNALTGAKFASSQGFIHGRLGYWYFRRNDLPRAIASLRLARMSGRMDGRSAANLAGALMTAGELDEAEQTLGSINVATIRDPVLLFSIFFNTACVKSLRGQIEEALAYLARAAQTDPISTFTSMGDPQLDRLRGDSGFQSLREALRKHYESRTTPPRKTEEPE